MGGRRIAYFSFLLLVGTLHFFYEQYVSKYILCSVLSLPIISLLLSLPAMLLIEAKLIGEREMRQGSYGPLILSIQVKGYLPLSALSFTLSEENLFTHTSNPKEKHCIYGINREQVTLAVNTEHCGVLRYSFGRGWAWDYLGLFAIPVKLGEDAYITVLPKAQIPKPLPDLVEDSALMLRPKAGGGYSEEHELRPYRPGDPLNTIHWKLSSKWDSPIVREPQVLQRKKITLLLNPKQGEALESQLGQLVYLADSLLEQKLPFTVYYGKLRSYIRGDKDIKELLLKILSGIHSGGRAPAFNSDQEILAYRILPQKEVDDA